MPGRVIKQGGGPIPEEILKEAQSCVFIRRHNVYTMALLGCNEQRVSLEDPPCKYRQSPIPLFHYNLIVHPTSFVLTLLLLNVSGSWKIYIESPSPCNYSVRSVLSANPKAHYDVLIFFISRVEPTARPGNSPFCRPDQPLKRFYVLIAARLSPNTPVQHGPNHFRLPELYGGPKSVWRVVGDTTGK